MKTNLDHNKNLLKHNESLHQSPYSSKLPSGTTGKTSTNVCNNRLPADILKKFKVKKEARKVMKTLF